MCGAVFQCRHSLPGANIGLSYQLSGAHRADAFQWPERWCDARRFRSLQALDPSRDRTLKLLDLALVLDEPWIVRHAPTPLWRMHQTSGNLGSKQVSLRAETLPSRPFGIDAIEKVFLHSLAQIL